jgi:hypothetical protein
MSRHFKQHALNDASDHAAGTNGTLLGTESNAVAEKAFGAAATASVIVQRKADGHITLPAGDPLIATDAANKGYVDEAIVSGNTWKEILLHDDQTLPGGAGGILQAMVAAISTNLVATDTFILTDGSTTETWTAVAGAPAAFQFQIGGSAAATLTNLVAAINADSTLWSAVETSGLDAYFAADPTTQMVVHRTLATIADDRMYGVLGTQTFMQVVEFATGAQDYRQASGTESDLPSGDPAAKRFGVGRVFADLNGGDTHRIANDNTAFTWDSDDEIWQQTATGSGITEGDGVDITANKISVDTATATAIQQYGGLVKNRTPDGSGAAGADAGHLAVQTDDTDLEVNASNQVAIKVGSRLDKQQADAVWESETGGDKEPTLTELNAALGTATADQGNRCMMIERSTSYGQVLSAGGAGGVGTVSTFLAIKIANAGVLADYHLVELSA